MGNGYSPKELVAVPQVIGASTTIQLFDALVAGAFFEGK